MDLHPDTVVLFETTLRRREFLIASGDDRARFVDPEGRHLGPVLPEPVDQSSRVCLLPKDDIVILGQYDKKTVSAFNWRTGDRLWRLEGIKEMAEFLCWNSTNVVLRQYTRRCRQIDLATGATLTDLGNVYHIWTDSLGPHVLLMLGRDRPWTIELREGLDGSTLFSRPYPNCFTFAAFGDGWLVLHDHDFGLIALDYAGNELWRYACEGRVRFESRAQYSADYVDEPLYHFRCITPVRNGEHLFGVKRSKASSMEGHPDYGVVLDGRSGAVLATKQIPTEHLAFDALAGGSLLVGREGLMHLPSMTWEPRTFRV